MSRTIIRKPAHRINSASHLRPFLVSRAMSSLLAIRRGEVDMLLRPHPRENSSVSRLIPPPRGGSGWALQLSLGFQDPTTSPALGDGQGRAFAGAVVLVDLTRILL